MHVLMFGTYDSRVHPRAAVLADGLARNGARVSECNAPLGLSTAARLNLLQKPWLVPQLGARLLYRWVQLIIRARRYAQEEPDIVVVGYMGHFDVHLARRLFPASTIVLDHLIGAADTAHDRGQSGSLKQRALRLLDWAALSSADVILIDTAENLDLVSGTPGKQTVVVPVGASETWFAAGKSTARSTAQSPLRVIFFGMYTPLQGAVVIGEAIARLPSDLPVDLTMIGTGQDLQAARAAAQRSPLSDPTAHGEDRVRVTWIDWVDPCDLPRIVATHDVCLGIFGTTGKAFRVVPNKVFQGAAAGCAVITSDTPPQRRLLGETATYVTPGDPSALAKAIAALADDRQHAATMASVVHRMADQNLRSSSTTLPLFQALSDLLEPTQSHDASSQPQKGDPVTLPPLSPNAWMRWDVVSRWLPRDISDVLEVGCGQGGFGARLATRYDHYTGVELDAAACAEARARLEVAIGCRVLHGDLSVLAADEQFDLVCAFEVIEHIENDRAALAEWAARLRPGGWLIVSTPAFQSRFAAADVMAGHFRRYEPTGLAETLNELGLHHVEVRQYGGPLGYVLEAGRNQVGRRRNARDPDASMADLTSGSGRLLQPNGRVQGAVTASVTWPFRQLQRAVPDHGPGLIARARRTTD